MQNVERTMLPKKMTKKQLESLKQMPNYYFHVVDMADNVFWWEKMDKEASNEESNLFDGIINKKHKILYIEYDANTKTNDGATAMMSICNLVNCNLLCLYYETGENLATRIYYTDSKLNKQSIKKLKDLIKSSFK